jgi:hypothetical protein
MKMRSFLALNIAPAAAPKKTNFRPKSADVVERSTAFFKARR